MKIFLFFILIVNTVDAQKPCDRDKNSERRGFWHYQQCSEEQQDAPESEADEPVPEFAEPLPLQAISTRPLVRAWQYASGVRPILTTASTALVAPLTTATESMYWPEQ